jgi:hypothetical protein
MCRTGIVERNRGTHAYSHYIESIARRPARVAHVDGGSASAAFGAVR